MGGGGHGEKRGEGGVETASECQSISVEHCPRVAGSYGVLLLCVDFPVHTMHTDTLVHVHKLQIHKRIEKTHLSHPHAHMRTRVAQLTHACCLPVVSARHTRQAPGPCCSQQQPVQTPWHHLSGCSQWSAHQLQQISRVERMTMHRHCYTSMA